MKYSHFRVFVSILVVLSLEGCVSTPPQSDALKITRAGGVGYRLEDYPKEKMNEFIKVNESLIPEVVVGIGYAKNYATAYGVSNSTAAVMPMLFKILGPGDPSNYNWILAWMPKTHADSEEDATNQLKQMVSGALEKSLPEGYTVASRKPGKGSGFTIQGEGCSDRQCILYSTVYSSANINASSEEAPTLIGGYDSYAWEYSEFSLSRPISMGLKFENDFDAPFDALGYYQRVSQNLPGWAYLYIGPRQGVTGVPVVFNQGQVMLFVKPENVTK